MLRLVTQRALSFAVSLLVASLLIFASMALLGGDAATAILGKQASPSALEALRERLGLDEPLPVQYLDWIGGMLAGDLGTSARSSLDIGGQIAQRLTLTLPLAGLAMLLTVAIAVPLGIYAAARHRRWQGSTVSMFTQVAISVPDFWGGLMLVAVFAVGLAWLPAGGFTPWSEDPLLALQSLILPAVALATVQAAILTRYVRAAVLEVMSEDYIRTARAKGFTRMQALWRHGLRNAAIPLVTIAGLQLAFLIGGIIVIENVFFLPGLGRLLVLGVDQRDVPLVQTTAMTLAVVVLALSFLVDVLYGVLDPRLRQRR